MIDDNDGSDGRRSTAGSRDPCPEIVILRHIRFEPGHRSRWMANADALIEATRLEPGCRRFEMIADPTAPTDVIVIEHFQDAAALADHEATVHFVEFLTLTQGCTQRRHHVDLIEATKMPQPG